MIVTARKLANAGKQRPRQADLRRAISTAYYAVFQALAKDAADLLVGVGPRRALPAWAHVYRALEHGLAKSACKEVRNLGFPAGIVSCAGTCIELQEVRHRADYDPNSRFTRAEALDWVSRADGAISALRNTPRADRRAFAILLLLRKRP